MSESFSKKYPRPIYNSVFEVRLPRNKLDPFRFNQSNNDYHLRDWFSLPKEQYHSLFEHQRVGVSWLYDLYQEKKGGILGDDMGLGKTVQVATLLQGLFSSN